MTRWIGRSLCAGRTGPADGEYCPAQAANGGGLGRVTGQVINQRGRNAFIYYLGDLGIFSIVGLDVVATSLTAVVACLLREDQEHAGISLG